MAQMPRGEPRSVPDPAGEWYDAMLRGEANKRQRAENGGLNPRILQEVDRAVRAGGLPNFSRPVQNRAAAGDNRSSDLVSVVERLPGLSPAEREEQRRAVARVAYMANSPLAGALYGFASLARASPQARDAAMLAGGAADALMIGAAPRGAPISMRSAPPRPQVGSPSLRRPAIRLGDLNERGQATGASATLTQNMLGTGTRANRRLKPPGWGGHGIDHNEARGHLIANLFGGRGEVMRNLVTLTQKGANSPQMRSFEADIARRVRQGEVVEYGAIPLYRDGILPPRGILVTAHGSRGAPAARIINNPAGRVK